MYKVFIITFVLVSCLSCKNEILTSNSEYSSAVPDFVIDETLNYNQVLQKALELDEKTSAKAKNILASYRKNLKAKPERAQNLKKNRKKKLDRILTPIQMQKRKYVNAVYYNTVPKYPTHPANIKAKYNLSDGQTLKLIEIEGLFVENKKMDVRKQRIEALIGKANATSYLAGKALII